jgi:hypothetical protein
MRPREIRSIAKVEVDATLPHLEDTRNGIRIFVIFESDPHVLVDVRPWSAS